MGNYIDHTKKASSEKIILAHIGPSQQLVGAWTQDGGDWYITAPHFVIGVAIDGVTLTSGWTFDTTTRKLTITTGSNPNSVFVNVTYRLFFSNIAKNLPYDLDSGDVVPYLPLIAGTSTAGAKFDPNDIAGISVEGSGSITLLNDDLWVSNFDGLNWQNKPVSLYSYGGGESVKLYEGTIKASQKTTNVVFSLTNFLYKFRSEINIPLYSESDGDLSAKVLGKPKRRVYGRVQGLDPVALDPVLQSYQPNTQDSDDLRSGTAITGSGTLGEKIITASSSDIADELVAGDSVVIENTNYVVNSIARVNFGLNSTTAVTYAFSGTSLTISFTGIDTTGLSAGNFVAIAPLKRGTAALNGVISGIWTITSVSAGTSFTVTVGSTSSNATVDTDNNELIVTDDATTDTFSLTSELVGNITDATLSIKPKYGYRRLNRQYNLCHHATHEVNTLITDVYGLRYYRVVSVEGLAAGDRLTLVKVSDGSTYTSTIETINKTANEIIVDTTYDELPEIGDTFKREPVQYVYHKQQLFIQNDEYTIDNTDSGTNIYLTSVAERDAADSSPIGNLRWCNGSRIVLGSTSLLGQYKPRDWIKPTDENTWYEISEVVSSNILILTKTYGGTSNTKSSEGKLPIPVVDNSKLWVDMYGITDDNTTTGNLVKTAADLNKHLLREIGLEERISSDSFSESNAIAPYLVSVALPSRKLGKLPKLRDVVNEVNTAVLSNLYYNSDFEICHTPMSCARLKTEATYIDDTFVLEPPQLTTDSTKIYQKLIANYNFQDLDLVSEESTYSSLELTSDYVEYSGVSDAILTKDYPLFTLADTQVLAQRRLFIAERAKSLVTLKLPLEFYDLELNDLVVYTSTYLYERASTGDQSRLGVVSEVRKDGRNVWITIDDIGDTFTRQAVIGTNDSKNYYFTDADDRRFTSHITDSNGLINNSPTTRGTNLIG